MRRRWQLGSKGDGLPLTVIQLVGRDAQWLARGAALAEAAGADIIDINMGCPVRKVCRVGDGIGKLQHVCFYLSVYVLSVDESRAYPTDCGNATNPIGVGQANEGAAGQTGIQPRGFRRSLRPAPNSGQFDRAGQKSAFPHDPADH